MLYLKDAVLVHWRTLALKRAHWLLRPGAAPAAVRSVPRGAPALDCEG
ncbi:MAG: hypothetical protein HYV15_01530, partial [Elusimicrobia bacterium]|nr:hypothetical protein [Elusimicrobiota bacterium]